MENEIKGEQFEENSKCLIHWASETNTEIICNYEMLLNQHFSAMKHLPENHSTYPLVLAGVKAIWRIHKNHKFGFLIQSELPEVKGVYAAQVSQYVQLTEMTALSHMGDTSNLVSSLMPSCF